MAEQFRIDVVVSGRTAAREIVGVERSLEQLNRTAENSSKLLNNALRVAGVGTGIVLIERLREKLTDLSDTYTQIQNRLGAVTRGTQELESVTASLLDVANGSRTAFEATAQLYARTALATKDLGTSQADLLGITETVNRAIILSGASTKEASNGLIQLSQAISSNRLAGDELRSVLEQLPVVADVIARQLGVTRGQLRELGKDGKITADVILNAFKNAREEIGERFAKTVPTVGQAIQVLNNQAIQFVGNLNKATGATSLFATALVLVGKNLGLLAGLAVAGLAVFAVEPVIRYVQALQDAAKAQAAFAAERAAGLAGPEAAALALQNEARATLISAQADVQKTQAALAAATAEQSRAVATFEATEATIAQSIATARAAQADIRKTQSAIAAAEAELLRAQAEGVAAENETFLFGIQSQLEKLELSRTATVQRLAAAEAELSAASAAATRATQGRAIAASQLAALQTQLAAQTGIAAAAQAGLNATLAKTPGLLARISTFVQANPFGVAVVSIGALLALFTDLSDLADTARAGVVAFGDGLEFVKSGVSSLTSGLGATNEILGTTIRLAAAAGAIFVALAIKAKAAGSAIALGLGAAIVVAGELARRLDQVNAALVEQGNKLAENSFAERLRRASQEVARLNEILARNPGNETAATKLVDATEKLGALERERLRRARELRDEDPLAAELAEQQDLIRILGLSSRQREIELDLIRRRKALLKSGVDIEPGSQNDKRLRESLEQVRAAEDLAAAVDDLLDPQADLLRQRQLLTEAEKAGRISTEQLSGALNKLSADARAQNPLADAFLTLKEDLKELKDAASFEVTGDARIDLISADSAERAAATTREVDDLVLLLRAAGTSEQELQGTRAQQVLDMTRQRIEAERINGLRKELLGIEAAQQFDIRAVGLSDFERDVLSATEALERFTLDGLKTDPMLVRNAALAREFGGVLNNLQSPLLAQQQAQSLVADEITRANEAMAAGVLTGQQYALVLQDLDFKARAASTSFSDGFTVALDQMTASINEATIGNQLLTSSIGAATSATSQFVQEGTVDFRKLALNVIDSIAQIITQLLILRAIKALEGFGGGIGGNTSPVVPGISSESAGFLAEGGRAQANKPFIVGEEGPELFVPGRSGVVVPNDQVAESFARSGGGAAAPVVVPAPAVNVSITNVTDPNDVLDAIDSPAGERRIVNAISRNPNAVRRGLGT